MNQFDGLEIISQTRGKVAASKQLTGENLFLVWGYPSVFFLMLEFLGLKFLQVDWCQWIWVGIPIISTPLMAYFIHQDRIRTHRKTHEESSILNLWIFVGCTCFVSGFLLEFAGLYEQFFLMLLGLLCGIGCFVTGLILRFTPMTACGLLASLLSFMTPFFQGELWPHQLLIAAMVVVVALIVPGHAFKNHIKRQSS